MCFLIKALNNCRPTVSTGDLPGCKCQDRVPAGDVNSSAVGCLYCVVGDRRYAWTADNWASVDVRVDLSSQPELASGDTSCYEIWLPRTTGATQMHLIRTASRRVNIAVRSCVHSPPTQLSNSPAIIHRRSLLRLQRPPTPSRQISAQRQHRRIRDRRDSCMKISYRDTQFANMTAPIIESLSIVAANVTLWWAHEFPQRWNIVKKYDD